MTMFFTILATLAVLGALALLVRRQIGFDAQRPADYAAAPKFDLRAHLSGPILCEGVIYGPTGRVSSRFVARMHGNWQGNRGVLREDFTYDSGTTQQREWQLTIGNDGQIRAEADDVVGAGTGSVAGGAMQLRYDLRLPQASGVHVLAVNDWIYLAPNGTLINRSQFRKFGIKLAELVATMRPDPQAKAELEAAE